MFHCALLYDDGDDKQNAVLRAVLRCAYIRSMPRALCPQKARMASFVHIRHRVLSASMRRSNTPYDPVAVRGQIII